jgi:hypothetical protein
LIFALKLLTFVSKVAPLSTVNTTLRTSDQHPSVDPAFQAAAMRAVSKLKNHASSAAFMLPVDEAYAPGYTTLIKRPMDLGTIEKLLHRGYYNSIEKLFADVRLIFSNCYSYNTDDSPVSKQAKKLEQYFLTEVVPGTLLASRTQASKKRELPEEISDKTPQSQSKVPRQSSSPVSVKQASALSLEEHKNCRRLLKRLSSQTAAIWFLAPVSVYL